MEKRGVATCQQCMYWEIAFLCKQINLSFKDMGKHLWHLAFYISSLCVIYILHLHFHGSLVHSLINHHRPPHDLIYAWWRIEELERQQPIFLIGWNHISFFKFWNYFSDIIICDYIYFGNSVARERHPMWYSRHFMVIINN
jgi:hypothetical protein